MKDNPLEQLKIKIKKKKESYCRTKNLLYLYIVINGEVSSTKLNKNGKFKQVR
jgi:hypothetical protein